MAPGYRRRRDTHTSRDSALSGSSVGDNAPATRSTAASGTGYPPMSQASVTDITTRTSNLSLSYDVGSSGQSVPNAAHAVSSSSATSLPSGSSAWAEESVYGSVYNQNYDLSKYKLRKRKFFEKQGRVIVVMWSEPAASGSQSTAHITTGRHGLIHQKPRFFIVIRAYEQHALMIGIKTYNNRGTTHMQPGVRAAHGIAFQDPTHQYAQSGETGLQPVAIRVASDLPTESLAPRSRINYSKHYTIEYNIAVRNFGVVQPEYFEPLVRQFLAVSQLAPAAGTVPQSMGQTASQRARYNLQGSAAVVAGSSTQRSTVPVNATRFTRAMLVQYNQKMLDNGWTVDDAQKYIENQLRVGAFQLVLDIPSTAAIGRHEVAEDDENDDDEDEDEEDEDEDEDDEDEDEAEDSDDTA